MRRKPESAQNLLLVKPRVANSLPASNAVILFAPAAVDDGTPAFYPSPREMPCFDCLQKTHAGNFPPEISKLIKTE